MSFPVTIRVLQSQPDQQVAMAEVPFASRPDVQNLDENEIITKTLAVGLNPTDWKHSLGGWIPNGSKFVVGCDSAGEVVAVGSAVKHVKVGDLVATSVHGTHDENNGAFSEYVVSTQSAVLVLPKGWTALDGAALPVPHLTAVQSLYHRLNLPLPSKPFPAGSDNSILIWGGSSAVGHHAIQLAVLSGLTVYTTASPRNHDLLRSIGATKCFNYADKDVVEQIKEASGGKIQYAIDCVVEKRSAEMVVDSIRKEGGSVVTTIPVGPDLLNRRKDVDVTFTILYVIFGKAFSFANLADYDASPKDWSAMLAYCRDEAPAILPKIKSHKLRHIEGGLDKVEEGLRIMQKGDYGAEKLVFSV